MKTKVTIILIGLLFSTACSAPKLYDVVTKDPEKKPKITITDRDVYEFSHKIVKYFSGRRSNNEITQKVTGSLQVVASAIAGALSGGGGSQNVITGLSTFSATIPELQNIIRASDQAKAFDDGVALVKGAEGRFIREIAKCCKGEVSNTVLTQAGGKLAEEVLSAIKVVGNVLVAKIPSIEELQKASGKFKVFEVQPGIIELEPNETKPVLVLSGGKVVKEISDKPNIADAKLDDDGLAANITAGSIHGHAKITFLSALGETTSILVKTIEYLNIITPAIDRIELSLSGANGLNKNENITFETKGTGGNAKIEADVSGIVTPGTISSPVTNQYQFQITAVKEGSTILTVTNPEEGFDKLFVDVKP